MEPCVSGLYIPLTRGQIKEAIRKLEAETGLDLSMAIVRSLEIGISVFTREKPSEYLKLFGNPAIFTRREFSKLKGLETITYATKTGAFQFTGYDKIQEMKNQKGNLYLSFSDDTNVLRLEYKIVRRRGVQALIAELDELVKKHFVAYLGTRVI